MYTSHYFSGSGVDEKVQYRQRRSSGMEQREMSGGMDSYEKKNMMKIFMKSV